MGDPPRAPRPSRRWIDPRRLPRRYFSASRRGGGRFLLARDWCPETRQPLGIETASSRLRALWDARAGVRLRAKGGHRNRERWLFAAWRHTYGKLWRRLPNLYRALVELPLP